MIVKNLDSSSELKAEHQLRSDAAEESSSLRSCTRITMYVSLRSQFTGPMSTLDVPRYLDVPRRGLVPKVSLDVEVYKRFLASPLLTP